MNWEETALSRRLNRIYDAGFADDFHQAFFDHSGFSNFGYWTGTTSSGRQAAENLVDRLVQPLLPLSGRVLDVACGQGGTTKRLARYVPPENITGINISAAQLAGARRNAPGSRLELMSAVAMAFPDDHLDLVFCVEAAFHFPSRDRFLREAFRVLRPGGHLVMTDALFRLPLPETIIPRINRIASPLAYRTKLVETGFEAVRVESELEPTWRSCRRALVRFAWERCRTNPRGRRRAIRDLTSIWGRGRLYDVALADYLLVWARKPRVTGAA